MKRFFIACVLLLLFGTVGAQKVYFIYIQAENNTPFFIKMGEKVRSSTAAGYLILPKLVDSTYQITIGRAGQTSAESRFSIVLNQKDRGFLLRETDGMFTLFDIQAMTSLRPLAAATQAGEIISRRTDAFAILLAQAANDPSLLEVRATPAVVLETVTEKKTEPAPDVAVAIPETEAPKPDHKETVGTEPVTSEVVATAPDTIKRETTEQQINTTPVNVDTLQPPPAVQNDAAEPQTQTSEVTVAETKAVGETPVYKRSVVTRRSESSTSEGFGLVFWDEAEGMVDTIRILIPNQNNSVVETNASSEDSKKFLDFTNAAPRQDSSVAAANEVLKTAEKKSKRCNAEADEKDFLKLRRNMAAEDTDEAMISEAKKVFKRTCFSTGQIKNLSTLFLSAGGKYQFFDAAYAYVLDREQYAALQSELMDEYYINRFKALIAQQ